MNSQVLPDGPELLEPPTVAVFGSVGTAVAPDCADVKLWAVVVVVVVLDEVVLDEVVLDEVVVVVPAHPWLILRTALPVPRLPV